MKEGRRREEKLAKVILDTFVDLSIDYSRWLDMVVFSWKAF